MRKLAVVVILLSLTACGTNPMDRGISGALIGAGTGAAIGVIAGGPAGAGLGAVVGAVAGGAGGALTSPNQIDLGKPIWR